MKKKVFVSSPTDWGDEVPWNDFLLWIWEKPPPSGRGIWVLALKLSFNILILNRQDSEEGKYHLGFQFWLTPV